MKCADCQQWLLEQAGEPLTEAVSAHLLECPGCRAAHLRVTTLRQLIGLKRHEQPDPLFEVRNVARVRAAVAEIEPAATGWFSRFMDVWSGRSAPALRYAAAGLLVALIGFNWLSVRGLPPLPPASLEAPRADQPLSYAVAPADAAPPVVGPVLTPLVVANSNRQPWLLEGENRPLYGTGSRLTGFEY